MDGAEFLDKLAEDLSSEIRRNEGIRKLTGNKNLVGAFAEATVRQLVFRTVSPLRICHGGVVDHEICSHPDGVRQLDTIIWSPCPAPAMFCAGEFGLVPRGSAFGILEIKASAYNGTGKAMQWLLEQDRAYALTAPIRVGLGDQNVNVDTYPALGVVCIKFNDDSDGILDNLVNQRRAVVLFRENKEHDLLVDTEGVHRLMNFLACTRLRAKLADGEFFITMGTIKKRT